MHRININGKIVADLEGRFNTLSCKVREVKSPIHELFRGYECIAVTPNKARYDRTTKEYVTSFHPKYQIAQRYVRRGDIRDRNSFEQALKGWLKVRIVAWEG